MELFISTKKRKKAQIWSIDLLVAVIIFLSAIIFFYKYGVAELMDNDADIDYLLQDGKLISNYLLSEGIPENWTADNVTLIGLTDGSARINPQKVMAFSNISMDNYGLSRRLLSSSNDYYVFFENSQNEKIIIDNVSFIGKNYTEDNPENLIKIERFAFYNSSVIKMVVYVW